MRLSNPSMYQPSPQLPLPLFVELAHETLLEDCEQPTTADLNSLCVRHPDSTFLLSVIDAGDERLFTSGDTMIVDRTPTAKHGDLVVANIHGELLPARLQTRPILRLQLASGAWLDLTEDISVSMVGVVTHIVHRL